MLINLSAFLHGLSISRNIQILVSDADVDQYSTPVFIISVIS